MLVGSDRRKFRNNFKEKLEPGESKFMRIGNIVPVHWRDKRDVHTLLNIRGTGVEIMERKHYDPVTKPRIIFD